MADPFALEVHHPVEPDVPQAGLPVLPVYLPREHDTAPAEVVTAAAVGTGGIAVLMGGSSTGKTRACWQALELQRGPGAGGRPPRLARHRPCRRRSMHLAPRQRQPEHRSGGRDRRSSRRAAALSSARRESK